MTVTKTTKSRAREWNLHLSNGEFFARMWFTRDQIKRWFKGARIDGENVFIA